MTALLERFSIEALIASRDALIKLYEDAAAIGKQAQEIASQWEIWLDQLHCDAQYRRKVYCEEAGGLDPHIRRNIDRAFWSKMINKSGVRDTMSRKTMEEMQKTIDGDDCPELTASNIEAVFQGLADNKEKMFGDFLISIYRRLSWNYKTNEPAKFGTKMILSYAAGYGGYPNINYDSVLLELERALATLAGIPVPVRSISIASKFPRLNGPAYGEWVTAHAEPEQEPTFSVKLFKNKNAHVRVRPDLIKEMNLIIAAAWPSALPWKAK